MLTVFLDFSKPLDETSYKKFTESVNLNQIRCTCGHYGYFIKHGYYKRKLKGGTLKKTVISILRVKCKFCKKTHAVFPSIIVPYSQTLLKDQINIINNHLRNHSQVELMQHNPLIDESTISYTIRNYYKYWKERLRACFINTFAPDLSFIEACFKNYSRQFMQIKCTQNIFVNSTHIT